MRQARPSALHGISLGPYLPNGLDGAVIFERSKVTEEMVKQLPDAKARALLIVGRVGRLGCIDKGEPYVVPINYIFENGAIYSHSLPGRKIEALRANPVACLQVDEIESDFSWRSVLAYGKFEEMLSPGERTAILSKLFARFPSLTPVESVMAQDAERLDIVVFRMVVDRITGVVEG